MIKKLNCFKNKSIYLAGIVLPIALVLVLPTFQQPVRAGAFQDGQSEAEQDFMRSNGQDKDSGCSPENGVDYCTGYKLGYESRWAHMWALYDCSSGVCQ
jgi:hypothetical protein